MSDWTSKKVQKMFARLMIGVAFSFLVVMQGLATDGGTNGWSDDAIPFPINSANDVTEVVDVSAPLSKPTIRVVCDTANLVESPTNMMGNVTVELSEPYPNGDLKYKLVVEQADTTTINLLMPHAQNGIELTILAGETVSTVKSPFRIMDGTMNSELMGVQITAIPTDPIAASFYTCERTFIMFQNAPPEIVSPLPHQYADEYPAMVPREYDYRFKDHSADLEGIVSEWNFGDGSAIVTVTGSVGKVSHTYAKRGRYNLSILIRDKDEIAMDVYKETETFEVNIGDEPYIAISPSNSYFGEITTKNPQIQVKLSAPFDYAVPVTLTVSPENSDLNGRLTLGATEILFNVGETEKTVTVMDLDGTARSGSQSGFVITPSITPGEPTTEIAAQWYKKFIPGVVWVYNEGPIIHYPPASTSVGDIKYVLMQGVEKSFAYSIKDCEADSTMRGMRVLWDWGDGTFTDMYGATGVAKHIYWSFGTYEIAMRATDKDGWQAERRFYVSVLRAGPSEKELWIEAHFPGGNYPGDDTDSDSDGLSNLWEFVSGTDPLDPADGTLGRLYPGLTEGGFYTGRYRVSASALLDGYTVQVIASTNLLDQIWRSDYFESINRPQNHGDWVEYSVQSRERSSVWPNLFMRLKVVPPKE